MPMIIEPGDGPELIPRQITEPEEEGPTILEGIGAALQVDNPIGSLVSNLVNHGVPSDPNDPDFNPLDHLREGEEQYATEFAFADSIAEMNRVRDQLAREHDLREIMADSPLGSFLSSAIASVPDPTNLLPFQFARHGASLGARLAGGAGGAAVSVAASEAVLQATQRTRTAEESAASIMLGGAIGLGLTGLGATLGRVSQTRDPIVAQSSDPNAMHTQGVAEMTAAMRGADPTAFPPEGTLSAASARANPDDSRLAPSVNVGETIARLDGLRMGAPALTLSTSPSAATREIGQTITDIGMYTQGEMRSLASAIPVETRVRSRANQNLHALEQATLDAWRTYRQRVPRGRRQFTRQADFEEAVGKAMRRGDTIGVPEVDQLAGRLRSNVVDPLFREAQAARILPDDVEPSANYFSRVFDVERIKRYPADFRDRIANYLRRIIPVEDVASDAEYDDLARGVVSQIMGTSADRTPLPFVKPSRAGALKARTLDIPDHEIEDFLESNAVAVLQRYVRTVVPDIELARAFGVRQGPDGGNVDPTMSIAERINDDYNRLIDAEGSPAARRKLEERRERDVTVATSLVNQVRGMTNRPSNEAVASVLRSLRNLNFVRMLGQVVISSLVDTGRIVMEEGLARTFGAMIRDFGTGFRAFRLAKADAQRAGTALEMALATTQRAQFDTGRARGRAEASALARFEQGTSRLSNTFAKATLLPQWTTFTKVYTAALTSDRIGRTVMKLADGQVLSPRESRKLARSGIPQHMAERIAQQFRDHGTERNGLLLAQTEEWTDAAAREAFEFSLVRDVDNTIITPGAGDAPIWTQDNEVGRTIFQFKRFAMASTQRVLISGLQARDMQALNGVLVMAAVGAAATALRDIVNEGEVRERSSREWIVEGVDRSGVLSLFIEGDAMVGRSIGHSVASVISGGEGPTRFAGRNFIGQALGPSAGTFEDLRQTLFDLGSGGDFTASDLHRIRRLMPMQNVFYLNQVFDAAEEGIARAAGIPERRDQ